MTELKITDPFALRLIMTDDLYRVDKQPERVAIEHKTEPEQPVIFNYSGENNKYILILIEDSNHETISSSDLATLTAILAGRKLELRDVAILNLHKHPGNKIDALRQFFSCSKIVLFGVNPRTIGLPDISNNEIFSYEGIKILATYSFAEMASDIAKKRLFWNEMKQL